MKIAVRYYSRGGNVKKLAEAIAKTVKSEAVPVDQEGENLQADLLFLGGALYAYGIDEHLRQYIQKLDSEKVGKVVLFSASWISKHAGTLMRRALEERKIPVESEIFFQKGRVRPEDLERISEFAETFIK